MRPIQKAAVAFGGAYLALGLVGFAVTGFSGLLDSTGDRLLVFHLNPFHNIVHIGVAAMWLLGARIADRGGTEGVFLGIGSVYLVAAFLGFTGTLGILAIHGPTSPANFLHLATGVAAIAALVTLGEWSARTPVRG